MYLQFHSLIVLFLSPVYFHAGDQLKITLKVILKNAFGSVRHKSLKVSKSLLTSLALMKHQIKELILLSQSKSFPKGNKKHDLNTSAPALWERF